MLACFCFPRFLSSLPPPDTSHVTFGARIRPCTARRATAFPTSRVPSHPSRPTSSLAGVPDLFLASFSCLGVLRTTPFERSIRGSFFSPIPLREFFLSCRAHRVHFASIFVAVLPSLRVVLRSWRLLATRSCLAKGTWRWQDVPRTAGWRPKPLWCRPRTTWRSKRARTMA